MDTVNLEELFIKVSETGAKADIDALFAALKELPDLKGEEVTNGLELLLDAWSDSVADNNLQKAFVISLSELNPPSTSQYRNVLADAIKFSMPPYLRKPSYMKAIGMRDTDIHYKDVVTRFNVLTQLKVGVYTFQTDNKSWGMVGNIDEFTGSVSISNVTGRNSASVPLTTVLSKCKVFKSTPNIQKLIRPLRSSVPKAKDYYRSLDRFGLVYLSDKVKRIIAESTLVPAYMSTDEFGAWDCLDTSAADVSVDAVAAKTPKKRTAADARSLREMYLLLKEMNADESLAETKISEEEAEKFRAFFAKDKIHMTGKEVVQLAESVSFIGDYCADDVFVAILEPLLNQYSFWAEHPENVALIDLEVWGKLPAKRLPQFIRATELLHSEEYIARYTTVLPTRCLNSLCDHVDHDLILRNVFDAKNLTSDILLWTWKNRKKGSQDLLPIITMDNVVTAISTINLPSAWLTAQRELKKLLIDNQEFQKILIDNAEENPATIIYALQGCKAFGSGEQQSLLVKLSRQSDALQKILEEGIGEQMLAANRPKGGEVKEDNQPLTTSIVSFNKRLAELDDIINVQIPENKQAIATARDHGDLKENSEYKYAKQNQALLAGRRAELEREISMAQPVNFRDVKVDEYVIIGSTVTLDLAGEEVVYHLVGAWDGAPEESLISYKTPIGEALYNQKVGAEVGMPDGIKATIKSCTVLSDAILATLCED